MLRELQGQLVSGLFDAKKESAIIERIVGSDSRSAEASLEIYRGSVFGVLSSALAEVYPVCKKLVGSTFFEAMAARFIKHMCSRSPDLADYGGELPEFIETFPHANSVPYLPDVARLEWAWHRAFNAPDSERLDFRALSRIAETERNSFVFQLRPETALLESPFPVLRIWEANQSDCDAVGTVALDEGCVKLLVWPDGLTISIDPLDEPEWLFLKKVRQETPFDVLCNLILDQYPNVDLGSLLASMVQRGCLARGSDGRR